MGNRIRQLTVRNGPLNPAQSEVWITVVPEQQTATTEVRGRLMGPSCPYSSTVEVAYPLRTPPPGHVPPDTPGITMRVVIPEASLWEPQCPFLYRGPIELWQDGQRCDRIALSHGLRSLQLTERGLRVNGRPLTLHGRMVAACSEEEVLSLHQAGYNSLVAPVEEATRPLWEQADRLGFLMLGQVKNDGAETWPRLERLSRHTSYLGCLMEQTDLPPFHALPNHGLAGLVCDSAPDKLSLSAVHFLLGSGGVGEPRQTAARKGDVPHASSEGCLILGNVR